MTKKLFIIAHAGAKAYSNENTLDAFQKAIDFKADMIELDCRLHKENKFLVFHDRRLDKLTPLKGILNKHTLKSIREITFKNQQHIPYLEEAIEYINRQLPINIELKSNEGTNELIRLLRHYLKNGWSEKDFLISSFNHHHIHIIKKAIPDIPIALLSAQLSYPYNNTPLLKQCIAIHQSISYINQEFVHSMHQLNLKVNVFTVNFKDDAKHLHQMGVDGIFTDSLFPNLP